MTERTQELEWRTMSEVSVREFIWLAGWHASELIKGNDVEFLDFDDLGHINVVRRMGSYEKESFDFLWTHYDTNEAMDNGYDRIEARIYRKDVEWETDDPETVDTTGLMGALLDEYIRILESFAHFRKVYFSCPMPEDKEEPQPFQGMDPKELDKVLDEKCDSQMEEAE